MSKVNFSRNGCGSGSLHTTKIIFFLQIIYVYFFIQLTFKMMIAFLPTICSGILHIGIRPALLYDCSLATALPDPGSNLGHHTQQSQLYYASVRIQLT